MNDKPNLQDLLRRAFIFITEDEYTKAENIINILLKNDLYFSQLNDNAWQYIADIYLTIGKYDEAQKAYIKAKNSTGAVFSLIMLSNLDEANYYLINSNNSPAKSWCKFLINLFSKSNNVKSWPTFLQIRQFLEFTVYHLLLAEHNKYLNSLLLNLDGLMEANLDSKKMVGAAYFHFGKLDEAIDYFLSAASKNQFDGEIYFNLGQIYLLKNNLIEALSMFTNASLLLPGHYPTKISIERVQSMLNNK